MDKKCKNCQEKMIGRIDRKFCSAYCKSTYHYYESRDQPQTFFRKVDTQLKANRRILKDYNKAGKATLRSEVLLSEGFDPSFFTHYWKNKKGQVYLFCYEYGFLKLEENGKEKYLLVIWQEYMGSQTTQ